MGDPRQRYEHAGVLRLCIEGCTEQDLESLFEHVLKNRHIKKNNTQTTTHDSKTVMYTVSFYNETVMSKLTFETVVHITTDPKNTASMASTHPFKLDASNDLTYYGWCDKTFHADCQRDKISLIKLPLDMHVYHGFDNAVEYIKDVQKEIQFIGYDAIISQNDRQLGIVK